MKQLVDDFAKYLYLPRVKNAQVILDAIQDGASRSPGRERSLTPTFTMPPPTVIVVSKAAADRPSVERKQRCGEAGSPPPRSKRIRLHPRHPPQQAARRGFGWPEFNRTFSRRTRTLACEATRVASASRDASLPRIGYNRRRAPIEGCRCHCQVQWSRIWRACSMPR